MYVLDAEESSDPAYRVPWTVDRTSPHWCTLINSSDDRLRCVSTQFFGDGWMEPAIPRTTFDPGDTLRLAFFGQHARDTARISVHWFHNDDEYVWTFVC